MKSRTSFLIVFLSLLITFPIQGCIPFNKDASFESSDRKFGDSEVLFKGRTFENVVYNFEKYRYKSGNKDVVLYRTTKRPILYNPSDPKWKVPYRDPSPHIARGYYVAPEFRNIIIASITKEEFSVLKSRANEYITKLKAK